MEVSVRSSVEVFYLRVLRFPGSGASSPPTCPSSPTPPPAPGIHHFTDSYISGHAPFMLTGCYEVKLSQSSQLKATL